MPLAAAITNRAPEAPTDEEVVEAIRRGRTHLFEELIRRHNRRLYRTVRSVLAREAEVEEVMQQTYVDAFTYLDGFRGAARFSTWLLKIGVHAALRRRRDLRRMVAAAEQASLRDTAPAGSPPQGPEQACAARELLGLVESAVDRLPSPYRQVLVLRAIEELDTAETAAVLGVAEEVVRQRLHRARTLLRQQFGGREDDGLLTAAFPFLAPRCQRVAAAVLARITTT